MDNSRQKIVEKYAKLMKLARGAANQHESESALKAARKLASDHGLTETEIQSGQMSAAFDDLLDMVKKIVTEHPAIPVGLFDTESIVTDVLGKIKTINDVEKAKKLRQAAMIVRTASLVAGDNRTLREIKSALDTVIKNHEITI
ncbi:MAG TPA: DUF2786 domain-containing protein [Conexivisphaerales archaeon]|nr:DUF2786 domain-containing protein [Conexivisphaerales archaeon]